VLEALPMQGAERLTMQGAGRLSRQVVRTFRSASTRQA